MRARHGRVGSAMAAAVIAIAATGCSGEDLAEGIVERQLEQDMSGDVDVDIDDDGEISIRSAEGNIKIDEDGAVIEGSDGEVVIQAQEGGDVPDGFPESVPVPDGSINYSQAMTTPEGESFFLTIVASGDLDAVADGYLTALTEAGFTQSTRTEATDAVIAVYESDDLAVSFTANPDAATGDITMSLTVAPRP